MGTKTDEVRCPRTYETVNTSFVLALTNELLIYLIEWNIIECLKVYIETWSTLHND